MALFTLRHSLYGRRFGISATGAPLWLNTTAASTGFDIVGLGRDSTGAILGPHDEPVITSTSSGGTTFTYGGILTLAGTATAATFLIGLPRIGQIMDICIQGSASALTFGGTSTALLFAKVGSAGSTTMTLIDANNAGNGVHLVCGAVASSAYRVWVLNGSTVIQA